MLIKQLFRLKPAQIQEEHLLKRVLHANALVLLGIGAIIGAGVFVLTGIAAARYAGPAIILSYVLAGIACTFTALSYSELASSVTGSGSVYSYAYAGLGEFAAWFIGWNLILEYGLSSATIAVGWSGYVNNILQSFGLSIPHAYLSSPFEGGVANIPAMIVLALLTVLLCVGTKQSARFNAVIVIIKLLAVAVFIGVAMFHVNPINWTPFLPFGVHGIVAGAALIFFAYIGFDAVSTTAAEAVNPTRDIPIGILGSLILCTLIYVAVSGLLTGIASYTTLDVKSPVAEALLHLGSNFSAGIIAAGAVAGLTTTMLVMFYGLTRVFYAISKDGLLPPFFSKVNPKTQTPMPIIIASGICMVILGGITPINDLAEMVNIGTLAAFTAACLGVIVMRIRFPALPRPFKTPFYPISPILGALLCLYLMISLPPLTWVRFVVWTVIGILIYFAYSRHHSVLNKNPSF